MDDFENIFTMLPENELIFTEWKKLVLKGIKGKRAHDARIVANALAHTIDSIATLNPKDFEGFPVKIITI